MSTTEHMQKNKTIFDRLFFIYSTLVFFESLLGIGTSLGDLQDVEADSFAEWSTFTYSHNVSHLHVPVNIQSSTYVANITTTGTCKNIIQWRTCINTIATIHVQRRTSILVGNSNHLQ